MKNTNIEFGKNYSIDEIRELFNLPKVTGGFLQNQIKEISKTYEIKKIKRGTYVILRELSETEKKYDKMKEYIEPMIYAMFNNIKTNSITMDMHELMEKIEIVNKDFNFIKWHIKDVAELLDQNEESLKIFTKESEPMLKRIIRDILYDMANKQLLNITEIPVVAYKIYDQSTKKYYTRIKEITSVKDIVELLDIKWNSLHEMGLKSEDELGYYGQSKFRDLIADKYGASYFYYKYKIVLYSKGIAQDESLNIAELKRAFNEHIQQKISKSRQGGLKELTKEEKELYIKYCIDTKQDFKLRKKIKETN